jgi:hypothetical protein
MSTSCYLPVNGGGFMFKITAFGSELSVHDGNRITTVDWMTRNVYLNLVLIHKWPFVFANAHIDYH